MIFNSPLEWILAAACGLLVGFLAGYLGVGGSFLMVPVLSFLPSIPVPIIVGSSACQVLGPATTAMLARGMKWENFRIPLILLGGLFVGIYSGAEVLNQMAQLGEITINQHHVPAADIVVFSIYFLLLTFLASVTFWEVKTKKQFGGKQLQKIALPPYLYMRKETEEGVQTLKISVPMLCYFGLITGFFSGVLGVSGGLIILPGLASLFGIPMPRAVVISLALVWVISIQATIIHAWNGNVNLVLVACLMLGGTIGARLGSNVGQKSQGSQLRIALGWLFIASATLVLIRLVKAFCF